jgi:preprotein translocase subunit SecF
MGSGPIKGFAVTLCIGILLSMFTAIVVTRLFLEEMFRSRRLRRPSFLGLPNDIEKLKSPPTMAVPIIPRRRLWYAISVIVIGIGLIASGLNLGSDLNGGKKFPLKLGIDFAGGLILSYQVDNDFKEQVGLDDHLVSEIIAEHAGKKPVVQFSPDVEPGTSQLIIKMEAIDDVPAFERDFYEAIGQNVEVMPTAAGRTPELITPEESTTAEETQTPSSQEESPAATTTDDSQSDEFTGEKPTPPEEEPTEEKSAEPASGETESITEEPPAEQVPPDTVGESEGTDEDTESGSSSTSGGDESTETASSEPDTGEQTAIVSPTGLLPGEKDSDNDGIPDIRKLEQQKVGAIIGSELTGKAYRALLWGAFFILLYVTWRFSRWDFGVAAIIALIHDVLVLIGVFAILRYEINSPFVAAMLTVVGYSINDTIVVFDRVRENLKLKQGMLFQDLAELSLHQTWRRSIYTSFTTLLVILTMMLFGGASIKTFMFALFIGIVSGTYSSVFTATPLLVTWRLKKAFEKVQSREAKLQKKLESTKADSDSLTIGTDVSATVISSSSRRDKRRRKGK